MRGACVAFNYWNEIIMNDITVNSSSFAIARTNKAGKTTGTRGLLGLIVSGTKNERQVTGGAFSKALWEVGTFKPIYAELERVFGGKDWGATMAWIELDPTKPNKAAMLKLVKGLAAGGAVKGEKAVFVGICREIVAYEGQLEESRAKREADREAAPKLNDGTTIDA
jgi:hypothetical protein